MPNDDNLIGDNSLIFRTHPQFIPIMHMPFSLSCIIRHVVSLNMYKYSLSTVSFSYKTDRARVLTNSRPVRFNPDDSGFHIEPKFTL